MRDWEMVQIPFLLIPRFRCWEEDYFVHEIGNLTGHPCHWWCVQVYGYFLFCLFIHAFWVILLGHSSSGGFIDGNPLLWSEKLQGISWLRLEKFLFSGYTCYNLSLSLFVWLVQPPSFSTKILGLTMNHFQISTV